MISPVLQSYSLTTAIPLQHLLDAADPTKLLILGLGQNACPWDLGAHKQETAQPSPTPGQEPAGFS